MMTTCFSGKTVALHSSGTSRSKRLCLKSSDVSNNSSYKDILYVLKQSVVVGACSAALLLGNGQFQQAEAAKCPELTTAENGLAFCDIKEGEGDAPVKGAFVKVHYDGRLDSDSAYGTFDSSYDRGKPLGFAVGTGQVIKGWDIGILGDGKTIPAMKPGGKRQLVIPPELGYGSRGAGGVIPPNSTLYFDVEYLGRLGRK